MIDLLEKCLRIKWFGKISHSWKAQIIILLDIVDFIFLNEYIIVYEPEYQRNIHIHLSIMSVWGVCTLCATGWNFFFFSTPSVLLISWKNGKQLIAVYPTENNSRYGQNKTTKKDIFKSGFVYHQVLLCLILYFFLNIKFNVRGHFCDIFLVVWKVWIGFFWPKLII